MEQNGNSLFLSQEELENFIRKHRIGFSPDNKEKIRAYYDDDPTEDDRTFLEKAKPEIIEYLRKKELEMERKKKEIESIPGVVEWKENLFQLQEWYRKLEESFEGEEACGGMGVGPKPEDQSKKLLEKYPHLEFFVEVEKTSQRSNLELYTIGKKYLEALAASPENWKEIQEKYQEEKARFVEKHMWD